jgi:hypothetical protein
MVAQSKETIRFKFFMMPPTKCPSSALLALRRSLGDNAKALDYLPFDDRVMVEGQHEVPFAVPRAIYFGTRKTKQPRGVRSSKVWVYLGRRSPSLAFKSWHTDDGRIDASFDTDDVRGDANSPRPEKLFTDRALGHIRSSNMQILMKLLHMPQIH